MKVKLLLISVLVLTGCARDGSSTLSTDNPNFPLTRLFVHERCAVYRFYDDAEWHYFVTCPTPAVAERKSCGKNCKYDEVIETVPVEAP